MSRKRFITNAMHMPPGPTKGIWPLAKRGIYWIIKKRIRGMTMAKVLLTDHVKNVLCQGFFMAVRVTKTVLSHL